MTPADSVRTFLDLFDAEHPEDFVSIQAAKNPDGSFWSLERSDLRAVLADNARLRALVVDAHTCEVTQTSFAWLSRCTGCRWGWGPVTSGRAFVLSASEGDALTAHAAHVAALLDS